MSDDTRTRKHAWIKLAAGATFAAALGLGTVSPALAGGAASAWPGAFSVAASRPAPAPVFRQAFSGHGAGALSDPFGVAAGANGNVWVADRASGRVSEFTPAGAYRSSLPVATPYGVATDGFGDVWVSSPSYAAANAVLEFSAAGTRLQDVNSTQSEDGARSNPAGIAVGPDGRIYVAQPDYGFVTVLNTDGSFYTEFGLPSQASYAGEDLSFPHDLVITPAGQVWVADSGHRRIAEFSPAASSHPTVVIVPPGWAGVPGSTWRALVAAGLGGLVLLGTRLWRRRPAGGSAGGLSPAAATTIAASTPAPGPALVVTRRRLRTNATTLTGAAAGAAAAGAAVLPLSVRKAVAASLASPVRATLSDIQHIVILMQENRSFDHYFGTMPGVRGFADPTAIRLPSGNPVYFQPDPAHAQGYLLPFHYDTRTTSAQATPGTDHSWPTQHQAWDGGKMGAWIPAKGPFTMGRRSVSAGQRGPGGLLPGRFVRSR